MAESRRIGRIDRKTKETQIVLAVSLDGGPVSVRTGVPFLDHMLTLTAAHGGLGLIVAAKGDLDVDDHHLVEDAGICLGAAVLKALGDRKGIRRYASALVPMDEALVQLGLDLSGRPMLVQGEFPKAMTSKKIKNFEIDLVEEFLLGFVRNAQCTLHVDFMRGKNAHHVVEAAFKAFGRALGDAVTRDGRFKGVPSTKGSL